MRPDRKPELIAELGRANRNLQLDVLQVIDAEGTAQERVGMPLATLDSSTLNRILEGRASALLPTTDGRWIHSEIVALGSVPRHPWLLGGFAFDDSLAFRLRTVVQSHVLLVFDGTLVGSTLRSLPDGAPGFNERESAPSVVELQGTETIIQYAPLPGPQIQPGAWIGIALPEPVAAIDLSLARARALSIALLLAVALLVSLLLLRLITQPLSNLTRTARSIAGGDLEQPFETASTDEIGILAESLEKMRVEIKAKLEIISRQATALRESFRRIAVAADAERHRMAQDLHDGVQQRLVLLRMSVGLAREKLEEDPHAAAEVSLLIYRELPQIIEELREVTYNIYPSVLRDSGLTAALFSYAGKFPISVEVSSEPDPLPRLDPELETSAYFVLSEAMTNVLKHAGASRARVGLRVGDGQLHLRVVDDGAGFEPETQPKRLGLLHMSDRARSFGGDLQVISSPGEGTEVRATFPLEREGSVSRDRAAGRRGPRQPAD